MDATMIKKVEQIARMAEQQAREAISKSALIEVELLNEIKSLKERIAILEGQQTQKARPTLKDKCDALVEILANCYQDNAPLSWDDWSEIRRQYVPDNDPDLAGVKEFFLRGQGKDLYGAVVNKPTSPDSKATTAPITATPTPTPPTQSLTPAPCSTPPAPAPKKSRLKGRVSAEPTVTLVDDPDNLATAPVPTAPLTAPIAAAPTPTFDAPATPNITTSLEEVASAGGLSALPSESLGRISNLFRSVLTGASASVIRDTMAQVEQADNIPATDRKRIIQFLIEGAAPVALQKALLESSPFVTSCFSSLFF